MVVEDETVCRHAQAGTTRYRADPSRRGTRSTRGVDVEGWVLPKWNKHKLDKVRFLLGCDHCAHGWRMQGQYLFSGLSSGHVRRAEKDMPRSGSKSPWKMNTDYIRDMVDVRYGSVTDSFLEYL